MERSRTLEDIVVGETLEDFQLLLELGRGSFARVFLAQQISMQRIVALKVADQSSVESPLLSNLDHPNIVRVFDERRVDGLTMLYMQYVPGKSLRQIIHAAHTRHSPLWTGMQYVEHVSATVQKKGETPLQVDSNNALSQHTWGETVAWLGARIAHALEHAHNKGVWHRDIKPENILIAADGRPMLADFNLSFGAGIDTTNRQEEFGGSFQYMSPEHLDVLLQGGQPETVNASSDVYSLAIVLWELLVGTRPFPEPTGCDLESLNEMKRSRLNIPRIEGRYECPTGLSQAIKRCLSPDPSDRPSARELTRLLQCCTLPEIHQLLYPDEGSRIARWQNRPMFWLIVLGLIPNVLLAGLSIWANHRLAIHNFDQDFFRETELIPVNTVTFTCGVLISLWIIWPIGYGFRSMRRLHWLTPSDRHRIAIRCLTAPYLSACNILLLFSISGIVFPLWNRWSPASQVTVSDTIGFFLSQFLHGLVAAGSTFVITALVTVRAFYPKFLSVYESRSQQQELDRFEKGYLAVTNLMAVTPLLALLALVSADHIDKSVFTALAMAGFASHLLSSSLTPRIRAGLSSLRFVLSPTPWLLQRNASYREM